MVEGGMRCVKYLLFTFNFIFFLAGLGLIIAGAVVQTKFDTFTAFVGDSFSGAAILLIIVGSVIFIIGFFGCCGAYKENYCMTMTFAVLLGIIFILEIAAGITAYAMRNQVKTFVEGALSESMGKYGNASNPGITRSWTVAQTDFKCCGIHNYTDWVDSTANLTANSLPDSCCQVFEDGCGTNVLKEHASDLNEFIFADQGCLGGFVGWVVENIYTVGGVGIGLAFVQVVGIILACCLARTIKKEYQVV